MDSSAGRAISLRPAHRVQLLVDALFAEELVCGKILAVRWSRTTPVSKPRVQTERQLAKDAVASKGINGLLFTI